MDETQFWQLIDEAREASGDDYERHADMLADKLALLSVKEIEEYQRIFEKLDQRVDHHFDLGEVADFIYGGFDDNGRGDFAAWLIGQGQTVYESVLDSPDNLADFVSIEGREDITAELLSYGAFYAYEKKTGDPYDLPSFHDPELKRRESVLKGASSKEKYDRHFKETFPKVWAKFKDLSQ
ncbi:MAG: DUF4240 domain-containing protein [Burkholderiales bacterium]|nr:DUF4240 domain-containing protein [Anaerolineae bacterium]